VQLYVNQSIEFPVEVVASSSCEEPKTKDNKLFEYNTNAKECAYNFMERMSPHRMHRLTTLGYESIMLRQNP
jgi:hypothetical protein